MMHGQKNIKLNMHCTYIEAC